MFEKEAEEIVNKSQWLYPKVKDIAREYCQKGAEFGYNKAREWHKVKDEGLPKNKNDCATYLLFTVYGVGGSPVVAHFAYRDKQELMNVWTGAILTEDEIVSWKEIVLPELKEIE